MVDISHIQKKQQADQRTALLGLITDKTVADPSPCLTDCELADLLDGVSSCHDLQRAKSHLAGCTACYTRWVELTRITNTGSGQKENKPERVFPMNKYTLAGSILAAAASIALFLNISTEVPRPDLVHPLEKADTSLESAPAGTGSESLPEDLVNALQREKKRPKAREMLKSKGRGVEEKVHLQKKQSSEDGPFVIASPPLEAERFKEVQLDSHSDRAGSLTRQYTASKAVVHSSSADWMENLAQACTNGETGSDAWQTLYSQGENLQADPFCKQKELVRMLLPLIKKIRLQPERREALCAQLYKVMSRIP